MTKPKFLSGRIRGNNGKWLYLLLAEIIQENNNEA